MLPSKDGLTVMVVRVRDPEEREKRDDESDVSVILNAIRVNVTDAPLIRKRELN